MADAVACNPVCPEKVLVGIALALLCCHFPLLCTQSGQNICSSVSTPQVVKIELLTGNQKGGLCKRAFPAKKTAVNVYVCCRCVTSKQRWARAWARIWTTFHPTLRGRWGRVAAKASSCPACWLAAVPLVDDLSCLIVSDKVECITCRLCQCFVHTVVGLADRLSLQIVSICNNFGMGPEFLLMLIVFEVLSVFSIQ